MEENNNQVMGDITEQVDNIITSLWTESVKAITIGDYTTAYNNLQSIFFAINPYKFEQKKELQKYTNQLEQLFSLLSSNNKDTEKKRLEYYRVLNEVKISIKGYLVLITSSLKQLGKWLRVYDKQEDFDVLLSDQTFGTDHTLIEEEIKELLKLDKETLLSYFSKGSIHNAYARLLIDGKNN